jgi:hypothetical protein
MAFSVSGVELARFTIAVAMRRGSSRTDRVMREFAVTLPIMIVFRRFKKM